MPTVSLARVEEIASGDSHLAVVATTRADGTVQASLVNAGQIEHPIKHTPVVSFVTYGPVKLANLRARPRLTVVFRSGWQWAAVEGTAELVGPDDDLAGFDQADLAGFIRTIFKAAGGTHDDWETFDRVMREERRTAVLVEPERVYSNRA